MGRRRRGGPGIGLPFLPRRLGCCGMCGVSVVALCLISVVFCFGVMLVLEDSAPQPLLANFTPQPFQADAFDVRIEQVASEAASSQRFSFSTTEMEAASWLNLNAPQYTNATVPVENVQVQFQDGKIFVYGEVDAAGFSNVPTLFEVSVNRTQEGQLSVDIQNTNMGGIAMPGFVVDQLRDQIRDAIDDQLEKISGNYFVEGLLIDDGTLSVQGRIVQ